MSTLNMLYGASFAWPLIWWILGDFEDYRDFLTGKNMHDSLEWQLTGATWFFFVVAAVGTGYHLGVAFG